MAPASIIIEDHATEAVRALPAGIALARVRPIIGRAGVNVVRGHLFKLDASRRNRLGGRRTHYYAKAARATHYSNRADGVAVTVSHVGVALRFFGGVVRPVNRKYLTIPANAKAHGRRAREFNNLEVMIRRKGGRARAVALVERQATTLRRTRKGLARGRQTGGKVYFWLVRKATMPADRSVLPTDRQLLAGIEPHVDAYLGRLLARQAATPE